MLQSPAPNPNPLVISPETKLGALHLRITSVERALPIWRDMVGLSVLQQSPDQLVLGIGDQPLVYLDASASQPVKPKSLGLYHIAIHVPSRKDLARAVKRQMQAGVRTLPTDHLVSEATYLWDEDGIGIELTFETPERGTIDTADGNMRMVARDGIPHSGVEPLDVDDLFAELDASDDLAAPLPEGTRLGHIHLHVKSLEESMQFYADTLGFQRQLLSDQFGMGDVKTSFEPHILAFNIWSGPQADQSDKSHAGLEKFEISVPDTTELDALESRLNAAGTSYQRDAEGKLDLVDPSGNKILLRI